MINLKNKGIGYYIAAAVAVLSLIVAIVFFITFRMPDDSGGTAMGNAAAGMAPETIGIFLVGGFLVECVVLLVPQYRFVQAIAILLFGLALYKDVRIIPDFIAGVANGVEYNHGNTPLNFFFFISLLVIEIAAIVSIFLGYFKDEKDAENKFSFDTKDKNQLVKVSVSAAVVVAAVLGTTIISGTRKTSGAKVEEYVDPNITEEIKAAAEACDYSFDPTSVIIKQQDASEYDYNDSELKGLSLGFEREDHNLVYYFEGSYSEGYQGDYSPYYAEIYLWDDGKFVGKSNSDTFRGYWFNSSLQDGTDKETGEDIKDCLQMVSNSGNYQSIICSSITGFYQYQAYIYLNPGWGGRSAIVSGYYYYPDVALFIDSGNDLGIYHVGDRFNRGSWVAKRVIKNLKYTAVFKADQVQWTDEAGMLTDGKFTAPGEYTVTAKWSGLEATKKITVLEAEEPEVQE